MKSATNMVAGTIVYLLRRSDLLHHAMVHHRDPVGDRHGLELVVRDIYGRRPDAIVQARATPRVIT